MTRRPPAISLVFLSPCLALLGACAADPPPAPPLPPLPSIEGMTPFEDLNPDPTVLEVELTAAPAQVELVPGTSTSVLAYNGRIPGPLLLARVGDRIVVHFTNALDEPTTIHWHGMRIGDDMDGTPMVQAPIQPGESFTYDFVAPDAGTFWFHPHINTIEQIERGLYGAIVIAERDPPRFTAERVLILDDVRLDAGGQIANFNLVGHDAVHGRVGGVMLQNGVAEPVRATVPRGSIERWRIVNASTSRTMSISVQGASVRVIGTDGGLLPVPYVPGRIELAVGQRFELEVTVDGDGPLQLTQHLLALDANDNIVEIEEPAAELSVEGEIVAEAPVYPEVTIVTPEGVPVERSLALSGQNVGGKLIFTINGKQGSELPIEQFTQGQPVRFTISNEIGPEHPFHLHGQFFQVLSRSDGGEVDQGLKDTVLLHGLETVTILTGLENPGRWMYHCHIPEHAEAGMMAELEVVPPQ